MQMRPCSVPSITRVAYDLSTLHLLPFIRSGKRKVAKSTRQAIIVFNKNKFTKRSTWASYICISYTHHYTISHSHYWSTHRSPKVYAIVCPRSVKALGGH